MNAKRSGGRWFSGISDYAQKNRFTKAVLGLSGGIDSALVAALACEALGAENRFVGDDAVAVFFAKAASNIRKSWREISACRTRHRTDLGDV